MFKYFTVKAIRSSDGLFYFYNPDNTGSTMDYNIKIIKGKTGDYVRVYLTLSGGHIDKRDYSVQDIKKGIVGALQPDRNKSILIVWVITKNQNLFTIARQWVFNDSIYEKLAHL